MKRDYYISVAMATFNGEKYIKEQIKSILNQLNKNDELVVSDDGSTDNTIKIIKSFKDNRIKIFNGPQKGVKQNFANAISNCRGKYIFLADQDDIWIDNKVEKLLNVFKKELCTCVIHDAVVVNSNDDSIIYDSFFKYRKSGKGILKNIWKNSYIGCCMAIDSEIIKKILPIPENIEMHDQWIGILCEKYGKSVFINDKLIKYRRHSNNTSNMRRYPLLKMIKNRFTFIIEFIRK